MEHSIFLAKVFSLYFITISLSMVFNRAYFIEAAFETVQAKGLSLLTALITLILGILLVLIHNVWVSDWRVLITIFSCLTLFKGIVRLLMPAKMHKLGDIYQHSFFYYFVAVVMLLLGIYLGSFGFN